MSQAIAACCLVLCVLSAALAQAPESQSIAGLNYDTPHYQLRVFAAGHFAVKIGGMWMPGCICLNINGTPQYQQEALSYMASTVAATPDGRKMTITGRLTPDFTFTQTLVMTPQAVELTYVVEALKSGPVKDISITAGPSLDQAKGLQVQIDAASGLREFTFPPAAPGLVGDVRSVTWRNLSQRDARTTFVKTWHSSVAIGDKRALYTAILARDREVKQGEKLTGVMRFEAIALGEAANLRQTFRDKIGFTRFGVSGLAGLLNNVRTDQGLLIQQLSINEDDIHQVQVGRGKGVSWGGVHVPGQTPQSCTIDARGKIVSDWAERVEAKAVSPARNEIHWTAVREKPLAQRQTRVLMYMAQWLEQEKTPFYIRTPDGQVKSGHDGYWMYFGMTPKESEQGLGPYVKLGDYPAGTEIVVPMPARGEMLTMRTGQPFAISGFRFEIYFRGLWFEALDKAAPQLDFDFTVEKLPVKQVGPLSLVANPFSHGGEVAVSCGGVPLAGLSTSAGDVATPGQWQWRALPDGAEAQLTVGSPQKQGGLSLAVPAQLLGKGLTYASGKTTTTALEGVPLRFGIEKSFQPLAPGMLTFTPSATERVSLSFTRPTWLTISPGGLALAGNHQPLDLTLKYQRLTAPARDPITARPGTVSAANPDPFSGLTVLRDQPQKGDLTVRSPYWEVVHGAQCGGAMQSIRFFNGTNQNILVGPVDTALWAPQEFRDVDEKHPKLEVLQATPGLVRLRATGQLRDTKGTALCPYEHLYEYRPMLVRRTCRYELGDRKVECKRLEVGSLHLRGWLDEAATRDVRERTTWRRAVFPGDDAFKTDDFSQYLCLFKRGVEGIDWLPACDLNQWQGFGGKASNAWYGICGDEQGNAWLVTEPVGLDKQPVELTGTLQFESYHSLPQVKRCLPRRNFVACLNTGECTEEMLQLCADYGVTDIMLGAGNTPGTFELSDLKGCQQAVQRARQFGIKVYPFDPFQLVNRRAPLWQQHELMAREEMRGDKSTPMIYPDGYGDYFCPQSKDFRDALKAGYTKLVESADFGGLYHDFTHPYICTNTRHWAGWKPALPADERPAAQANDGQHLNTDGVLDMILWDRKFLGPDRVFCGHTGWVPVLFFQDLCTVSAIFEEYPSTEPLPLHLTPAQGEFVNAAQMTLVSSFLYHGAAAPGEEGGDPPPPELVNAYLSRCALTGIFPWAHSGNVGAEGLYDLPDKLRPWLRLFALRGSNDLGTMQFLPWHRQTAVLSANPYVRAATYWNADRAIVVLANSESAQKQPFSVTVLPEQFGWTKGSKLTLTPTKDCAALPALGSNRFEGKLSGFGWVAYEVRR